eukprot:3928245-Alexandrium_andersonii.AAC.1
MQPAKKSTRWMSTSGPILVELGCLCSGKRRRVPLVAGRARPQRCVRPSCAKPSSGALTCSAGWRAKQFLPRYLRNGRS